MAKESMNEFIQQVGTVLYRYLRRRGLAHEDAEDIVQDTCYKFLLQFYDLKRKEKRHPTTNTDEVQLVSLANIPEILVLKREKSKDIRDTLNMLSNLHEELLVLKYELGLSYKEISAFMNMNENTLKTHVRRAKEEFIKRYKEDIYDE